MPHHRRLSGPTLVLLAICTLRATPSLAIGPYTDELSKCLVKSTSENEKTLLVRWMFAVISLHPAVKPIVTITVAQRKQLTQQMATVVEHVLTVSCRTEAEQAVKYEGNGALETSFSVLGQAAARELFANPQVTAGVADLQKSIDGEKLKAALRRGQ